MRNHTESDLTPQWVSDLYNNPDRVVFQVPEGATMANPPHPGEMVREFLDDLSLTVTKAADALNVSRNSLTEVVLGKRAVSLDMATRLELVFGLNREMWLKMQVAHDLWHFNPSDIRVNKRFIEVEYA